MNALPRVMIAAAAATLLAAPAVAKPLLQPLHFFEGLTEGIGTIKTTVVREKNPHSYVRDGLPGRLEMPPEAAELLEKIRNKTIDMNTLGQYSRLTPR